MDCYLTHSFIIILSILFVIPLTESRQCSNSCIFSELQLNSSIPTDFCPSFNDTNTDTDRICSVKLHIDFSKKIVNGSFSVKNQTSQIDDRLIITTYFSLNDTSIKIDIDYQCSISDYCDIEFAREILSSILSVTQLESIREELAIRLYNGNDTGPFKCFNDTACTSNTSICYGGYLGRNGMHKFVLGLCSDLYDQLEVIWTQEYKPYNGQYSEDSGEYPCNTLKCASNARIIENFQWLSRNYILPVNISVINITTTRAPTTTILSTTSTQSTTITTSNNASLLFQHLNIVILSFMFAFFLNVFRNVLD